VGINYINKNAPDEKHREVQFYHDVIDKNTGSLSNRYERDVDGHLHHTAVMSMIPDQPDTHTHTTQVYIVYWQCGWG